MALLDRRGAVAKAAALRGWLSGLVSAYGDKILDLDTSAATVSGQLEAKAIGAGHDPGMADAAIAGIASAHELVIVTRNMRHCPPFGLGVSTPDRGAGHPGARPTRQNAKARKSGT